MHKGVTGVSLNVCDHEGDGVGSTHRYTKHTCVPGVLLTRRREDRPGLFQPCILNGVSCRNYFIHGLLSSHEPARRQQDGTPFGRAQLSTCCWRVHPHSQDRLGFPVNVRRPIYSLGKTRLPNAFASSSSNAVCSNRSR